MGHTKVSDAYCGPRRAIASRRSQTTAILSQAPRISGRILSLSLSFCKTYQTTMIVERFLRIDFGYSSGVCFLHRRQFTRQH